MEVQFFFVLRFKNKMSFFLRLPTALISPVGVVLYDKHTEAELPEKNKIKLKFFFI